LGSNKGVHFLLAGPPQTTTKTRSLRLCIGDVPGSRGTKHFRLLIPKGITGITENDRATLQAWLELVDWTGLGVLPNSQVPRKLKLNIDSASELHQWLTLKELQYGVRNHEAAQIFLDNQKELRMLADAIRNQDPNAESRVELMSGGEALHSSRGSGTRETKLK
jgi:dsDNA-binding SOS-regulon protein